MTFPAKKPPARVSEAMKTAGGASPGRFESGVVPVSNRKVVVVVDDDVAARTLLVRSLSSKYTVYEAGDGLEALQLMSLIPRPHLVLCDVMMPRLDGITLARTFKAHPVLRLVPIIFVTARCSAADMMRGLSVGAKQYVTKPYGVKDLVEKIDKILE